MQEKYEELYHKVENEMKNEKLIKEYLMEISSIIMDAKESKISVTGLIGTPIDTLTVLKDKLTKYAGDYGFKIHCVNFTTPH